MNEVANKTNQWQMIAIQLDFDPVQIERIDLEQHGDNKILLCFQKVFTIWKRQDNPPFTWQEIITALKSDIVKEYKLAKELSSKYL